MIPQAYITEWSQQVPWRIKGEAQKRWTPDYLSF
jgi:hypothetical protein